MKAIALDLLVCSEQAAQPATGERGQKASQTNETRGLFFANPKKQLQSEVLRGCCGRIAQTAPPVEQAVAIKQKLGTAKFSDFYT